MDAVHGIFAYLARTLDYGLNYSTPVSADIELHSYVNSDYMGCPDTRKSTTGWLFLLGNTAISWKSKRQTITTTSTCEAEYVALGDAAKEAMYLRNFINDVAFVDLP